MLNAVGLPCPLMRILCFILFIVSSVLLTACDKPDRSVRHYREINFAEEGTVPSAPAGAMPDLPPEMQTPTLPLTWVTPEGWSETKGSGMRVVTFTVARQECSILTFPGDVGGDEANIERWIGQLGVNLPHEAIHQFSDNPVVLETAGGFKCKLFDFADLVPAESSNSMLAGIIPVGEHTAFVKLMGDAVILKEQKDSFVALCQSIGVKSNQ